MVESMLKLPTESWGPAATFNSPPTASPKMTSTALNGPVTRPFSRRCRYSYAYSNRGDVPDSRSRGIPADVTGPIRLVEIDQTDTCTCCGTHVKSLGDLQVIKLLHQEPKAKTCRLFFVLGERVTKMFGTMYQRERALTKELGTNPENFIPSNSLSRKEASDTAKALRKLMQELAVRVGAEMAEQQRVTAPTSVTPLLYYREDVDIDFLIVVAEAVRKVVPAERLLVFGCGKPDGQCILSGPSDVIHRVAPVVMAVLEGKGAISRNIFRAKASTMKNWKKVQQEIEKALAPSPPAGQ